MPEQWPDFDARISMCCPHCGSNTIKIPIIKAPEGYAFDAALTLVTCWHCGRQSKLSDVTVIAEDAS